MAETCNAPVEVKRAYATKLAPQLIKDHGKKKHYGPEQIRDSVWRDYSNLIAYGCSKILAALFGPTGSDNMMPLALSANANTAQ